MARAINTDVIEFTSPTSDWAVKPTYFGFYRGAGQSADFVGGSPITNQALNEIPEDDARIRFLAGTLVINITGALNNAREVEVLVEDILEGTGGIGSTTNASVWVSLHSGDPGETGANELVAGSNPPYARVRVRNWTITN